MAVSAAGDRDDRAADEAFFLHGLESPVISAPKDSPSPHDVPEIFQFGPEKSGGQFTRQERRSQIHPGVLIHLAFQKSAAISSLVPDDLGPFHQSLVVDQECPALAGDEVCRFVEAKGAQVPQASQGFSLILGANALGRVLNDQEAML